MQKIVAEDWELDPGFRERLAAWDVFLESFDGLLPGGVGIFNFDGNHIRPLYVSESAVLLCEGIEPELRGEARENAACLLPEEDQKKLRECAQTARRNSKILDCVIRYYTSKNKKGWMWVRGRVMNEYRDRLVYMMVLLDVTAQKEMENELRIQNERYLLLEETSNEILFELKLNEDVLTYSYRELNGELNRRRISHYSKLMRENPLVHPEYRDMFQEQLLAASRGAVQNQMEYLSRISGNGYEWHRVYYKSVEDESGNVLRIIGRIRNIHDEVLKRQRGLQHYHVAGAESAVQREVRERLEDADLEDSHAVVILSVYSFKKLLKSGALPAGMR